MTECAGVSRAFTVACVMCLHHRAETDACHTASARLSLFARVRHGQPQGSRPEQGILSASVFSPESISALLRCVESLDPSNYDGELKPRLC